MPLAAALQFTGYNSFPEEGTACQTETDLKQRAISLDTCSYLVNGCRLIDGQWEASSGDLVDSLVQWEGRVKHDHVVSRPGC